MEGFRFQVSGVSQADDGESARFIEIETLIKRISNIEQGIMNVEGMCSVDSIKMTEQCESSILDHFSHFKF